MAELTAEVIRRAQAGDRAALAELVRSQQGYVYSIALSVLRDPADAADLTQEAFVRLLRALPTYRFETKFTTWLYRLVVNLGLDELRRRGRPVASLDAGDEEERRPDPPDDDRWADPVAVLDQRETARRVREALGALPLPQRLALTLYYFEDLRYEDIAAALALPLNTVKSHIRRGKERLARLLADEAPDAAARTGEAVWAVRT